MTSYIRRSLAVEDVTHYFSEGPTVLGTINLVWFYKVFALKTPRLRARVASGTLTKHCRTGENGWGQVGMG